MLGNWGDLTRYAASSDFDPLDRSVSVRVPLKDITEIRSGYQPRQGLTPSQNGTHLVIQARDVDRAKSYALLPGDLDKITPLRASSVHIVRNGDILFMSRGKRRIATLVEGLPESPPTIALYYFFILRVTRSVDPGFLVWAINEPAAQDYLQRVASGTGMPFVTREDFENLELSLPKLEVQTAIGKLHCLSRREIGLLQQLEKRRAEVVTLACRTLFLRGQQ